MSTEVAPPLAETLKKKPNRRFASVKGGFDAAQVDAFLVAIASSISALEAELQQFKARPPAPSAAAAEGSSKRIENLGRIVEREVEKMLEGARAEAATILAEAGREADGITKDAQADAARSVDEARTFLDQVQVDARRIPTDAAARRQHLIDETQEMQERLFRIAKDLDRVIKGS